jgi:hypothetical protein
MGYRWAILSASPYSQTMDLPSGGPFSAVVVENGLDNLEIQVQQVVETLERAVLVPPTSAADPQELLADLAASSADAVAAAAAAAASETAAAGSATNASNSATAAAGNGGRYSATVGGTADAITLTPSPSLGAYVAGEAITFIAAGTNTGAVTVNVSGLGAKSVTKTGATALVAGEIVAGQIVTLRYDGVRYQVITPAVGTAALKNTGISGDTVPLCNSNPTIGNILITVGASLTTNNKIALNGGAGYEKNIEISTAGVKRWVIGADPTNESGGNLGSNLQIVHYSDLGGYLSAAARISRIDGAIRIGTPTGGFKGAGTLNAVGVYDDDVLLTCYAIEAYKQGSVDIAYWDAKTLDLEIPAQPEQVETRQVTRKVQRVQRTRDGARLVQRMVEVDEPVYDLLPVVDDAGQPVLDAAGKPLVESVPRTEQVVVTPGRPARTDVRTHGPAARFAARADELLDPAQYAASWKATGHLPAMPSPAEWEAADKKMSLGDIQQRLWETVEVQAIHIDKLLARIEALEAKP